MSLTLGHGPLAARPAPANFAIDGPAHRIHFEPFAHRVRAQLGASTVLDTTRGALLHETGILPVFYAPLEDYDGTLLQRTDHTTHCPFKGDASYWTVGTGERTAENALWAYEQPLEAVPWLKGYAALYVARMDRWLDEDEEVVGHLRDPYHRVDARRTSRTAEVRAGDQVLACEAAPVIVFETGVAPRPYIRRELLALEPSERRTVSPYMGLATYWSIRLGDTLLEDAAWSYETPLDGMTRIAGLIAVDHEAITVALT